ncbi:hypothetical protein [Paenibacillus sp. FSL H7-0331]|uniref:hypothetical protein n=1 Tax=Paenibacillus sp. FSL H7-0331 TaxID=1920421 RepID=UPI00096D5CF7|nr:hypothetical protein [Paenibacillus sp. FSL H7-0331]OMF12344.1 hypothetical protein BK127_23015 [Paenibacillus sp. FSL H7-0331]
MAFGGFSSSSNQHLGKSAVTIAPHDATWDSKKKADIVLTGVDDQNRINEVIQTLCTNPAASFGSWKTSALHFTEGQINLSGSIFVTDALNISGMGNNTIFRLQNGAHIDMFTHSGYAANETIYKLAFRNFLIDGNYANNTGTPYAGIKLRPQEYVIENLWVTNCYSGLTLYGENTYGGFIQNCMIQNNFNYGLGVGGDSIVIGCGIGGNGKDPSAEWLFGTSGLLISGWNTQVSSCHFADNLLDIFSHWSAYNQIQTCVFEAGRKECIRLEGRVWGCTITGNRFGGRKAAVSSNAHDCVTIKYIDPSEKAYGNIISNNSFTCYESGDVGYNYCVVESENCDHNLITNNIFMNGYAQASPVHQVGENTVIDTNIN